MSYLLFQCGLERDLRWSCDEELRTDLVLGQIRFLPPKPIPAEELWAVGLHSVDNGDRVCSASHCEHYTGRDHWSVKHLLKTWHDETSKCPWCARLMPKDAGGRLCVGCARRDAQREPGGKRQMATIRAVVRYWCYAEDIQERTRFDWLDAATACWACNANNSGKALDRAHLTAHQFGGSGKPDNLVLLCRPCHREMDNMFRGGPDERQWQLNWITTHDTQQQHVLRSAGAMTNSCRIALDAPR